MEKLCSRCQFTYPASAAKCKACGGSLIDSPSSHTPSSHNDAVQNVAATTAANAGIEDQTGAAFQGPLQSPAKLRVAASQLSFRDIKKGKKVEQSIVVENLGECAMEGFLAVNVPWLMTSPSHIHPGLAEQIVRVEADSTCLQMGRNYLGDLSLYTSGGDLTIPISVSVAQPRWRLEPTTARAIAATLFLSLALAIMILGLRSRRPGLPQSQIAQAEESPYQARQDEPTSQNSLPAGPLTHVEGEAALSAPSSDDKPDTTSRLPEASREQSATLSLTAAADDLKVSLDGNSVGMMSNGQTRRLVTAPGQHTIRATKEGYPEWERSLSLEANERQDLVIRLETTQLASQRGNSEQSNNAGVQIETVRPVEPVKNDETATSHTTSAETNSPQRPQTPQRNSEDALPSPAPAVPMSVTPLVDGKYLMVIITGRSSGNRHPAGAIEVVVSHPDSQTSMRHVSGSLPGQPCGIGLVPIDNVAEYSFQETPSPANQWGRAKVRVRPKDSKRNVRFTIDWRLR